LLVSTVFPSLPIHSKILIICHKYLLPMRGRGGGVVVSAWLTQCRPTI